MFKKIVWLWFSTKWKNSKDVEKYIESLVLWWANEFFTWYNPPYWSEKFGYEVSPNGRFSEHEQITDFETLKQITQEVHKYWFELFINLNAWYYTDITFEYIKKMVDEFIELWIDWIICWSVSILEYLKEINYSWKINISTIFALYNTQSIRFFLENYKINKVILSREITLNEIENIVNTFPETLFEVFWEWDFCRYNNGLCYAEHKYATRDICTVVVNDLIFKKKFRADFKKIILDENISPLDKTKLFDDKYIDIFEEIITTLWKIELDFLDNEDLKNTLLKLILKSKNRVDLFFDWLKPLSNKHNKNVLNYLKALKYLINQENIENKAELEELYEELNIWFKNYIKFIQQKTISLWWEPKLKALETNLFYSKWDNLNLYSYLFFSNFKNIQTVKFPTRWRNYNEKLKIIEQVVNTKQISKDFFDNSSSISRAHYDLTYLFKEKLWFRNMLKNINFIK